MVRRDGKSVGAHARTRDVFHTEIRGFGASDKKFKSNLVQVLGNQVTEGSQIRKKKEKKRCKQSSQLVLHHLNTNQPEQLNTMN